MNERGQTEVSVRVKKTLEKQFAPKSAAAFGLTGAQNFYLFSLHFYPLTALKVSFLGIAGISPTQHY